MEEFLAANPGLSSRFSHRVQFADYTNDELVTIVNQHAASAGYECTGPTVAALRAHFVAVPRGTSFGNGRACTVREIMSINGGIHSGGCFCRVSDTTLRVGTCRYAPEKRRTTVADVVESPNSLTVGVSDSPDSSKKTIHALRAAAFS